jgi:hypothetical protein
VKNEVIRGMFDIFLITIGVNYAQRDRRGLTGFVQQMQWIGAGAGKTAFLDLALDRACRK